MLPGRDDDLVFQKVLDLPRLSASGGKLFRTDRELIGIGQQDAQEADATTGLYFSLNDMDAQVANVLLAGGDTALAANRTQDLATYASDRAAADADLQRATVSEASQPRDSARTDGVYRFWRDFGFVLGALIPGIGLTQPHDERRS